ncbi:MAG: hypothetical protein CMH70_05345 [Nitrosomonadaceae bacterium]|nr:hypothetical protein [Nitrosomonadaceae bacterium]
MGLLLFKFLTWAENIKRAYLFLYSMKNFFKILTAQLLTIIIVLVLIEMVGQIYARFHPGYETLSAIPDSMIGWRLAPNLKYTYTGGHWYAHEFSAKIKNNALGFRDFNRKRVKPPNTKRIALLGDSLVQAEQVAFQNTPGQVLEQLLNNISLNRQSQNFEVLNFGIGGIGIGQSLLVYRQYARVFNPDFVFLFIFIDDIYRTIAPFSSITNTIKKEQQLAIRPVFNIGPKGMQNDFKSLLKILNFADFHQFLTELKAQKIKLGKYSPLKKDEYIKLEKTLIERITNEKIAQISEKLYKSDLLLILPPQKNYEEFGRLQGEVIAREFGEDRTKIRERKIFLLDIWRKFKFGLNKLNGMFKTDFDTEEEFNKLIKNYAPRIQNDIFSGSQDYPNFERVVFINLKILETMNRDITKEGKKFIIVDASSHLANHGNLPAKLFSTILSKYCEVNKIGYIPLHQPLDESVRNGNKTTWKTDSHFNENGYRIFGEAMFKWITDGKNNLNIYN